MAPASILQTHPDDDLFLDRDSASLLTHVAAFRPCVVSAPLLRSRRSAGTSGPAVLSTVINYIDRQTLSVLAPVLKTEFRWTNADFALVIIAFRVAYAIGQTPSGRLLDRVGTRAGLTAGGRVLFDRGDAHVARHRPAQLLPGSVFCSASASRRTGRARPKRSPSGFRGGRAAGRWRCSTAARRSAPRSRRSSCSASTRRSAAGGRRSSSPALLGLRLAVAVPWLYRSPEEHPRLRRRSVQYILAIAAVASTRRGRRSSVATARCFPAADLGHRHRQGADRSGLVLHHRLVRDLSRVAGLRARGQPAGVLGAVSSPRTSATSPAAALSS